MTRHRYRIPSTSALQAVGDRRPGYQHFNNYIYLLEAAAAGKGVALGWRGLIDRYIESGVLVEVGPEYLESERAIYAVLTGHGREKPLARRCLECLAQLP